jgi:hypothetical protein
MAVSWAGFSPRMHGIVPLRAAWRKGDLPGGVTAPGSRGNVPAIGLSFLLRGCDASGAGTRPA